MDTGGQVVDGSTSAPAGDASASIMLSVVLRRLRRERELSQRAMSHRLHLGSHSSIADYEAGRRIPPHDIIVGYERVFGVAGGELLRLRERALVERAEAEAQAELGADRGRATPAASCVPNGDARSGPGDESTDQLPATRAGSGSTALDGSAQGAVPRQLPAPSRHFVGRDDHLATLDGLLAEAAAVSPVITVIAGMAGIGKTTLAVYWAHRRRDRFPDGDLYVDLRGYHPSGPPLEPGEVLGMFLGALGVPAQQRPPSLEERAALYRTLLTSRQMLVMLDNARTVDQVRPLLPGNGSCMVLVTSRSSLGGLVAREGAHRIELDVLDTAEAIALFEAAIGATRASREPAAVVALIDRCGFHPLALRVAAERVASRASGTVVAAVAELDRRRRLDVLTPADDPASGVRSVLDWSYDALPVAARRLLSLLGLSDGPDIDGSAAAAVADIDTNLASVLLETLTSANLLTEWLPGRFRLHDLIRTYARERLAAEESPEQRRLAVRRLAGWYLHSACAARAAMRPALPEMHAEPVALSLSPHTFSGHGEALAWFELERANLVAATAIAEEHGLYRIAAQLPTAMYGFFDLRKYYADWFRTHEIALRSARASGDRGAEGRILCNIGNAYQPLGRLAEAVDCYRRALPLFAEVGYRQGEAKVLGNLGSTYVRMGLDEDALAAHARALAIFRELDDGYGEGLELVNVGELHHRRGRYAEAADSHRAALAVFEAAGDRHGVGRALMNLGMAQTRLGEPEAGLASELAALEIFQETGDRYEEAHLLAALGEAYAAVGDDGRARARREQALARFAEIGGDPREEELRALL